MKFENKTFLITGASGFVGSQLVKSLLQQGAHLHLVGRSYKANSNSEKSLKYYSWNYEPEDFPRDALIGVSGVIHLMGEPIANGRWTSAKKKKIYSSRILSTQKLVQCINTFLEEKNKSENTRSDFVFISASAVGIYGNQSSKILTEENLPLQDTNNIKSEALETFNNPEIFLSSLCSDWEREAQNVNSRNIQLRIGAVLSPHGGALEKMLMFFKKGLGGKISTGNQWMSWIHINDLISIIESGLSNTSWQGAFNAVSPNPVTNSGFTRALSQRLKVPALFPVPEWTLKLLYGDMATILTSSQRALPQRLLDFHFEFQFSEISLALEDLVNTNSIK